ncbi:MAG: Spo0E family sporulation regulatory protein-aspartic acid phosphatase [Bacillota bacterium]
MDKVNLLEAIERIRDELEEEFLKTVTLNNQKLLNKSRELDRLIVEYYNQQKEQCQKKN